MRKVFKMIGIWSRVLGLLGLGGCAIQPEEGLAKRPTSVLFIGNSYSFGVPGAFSRLAGERGQRVKVGHSTHGGWTLAKHSGHEPTLRKLRSRKWDVVVLQDHSLNPVLPDERRRKEMDEAVAFFGDEVRRIGARPVLFQTWGRLDGDGRVAGDDFFAMNARVRRGVEMAAEFAGGMEIAPVGDAWEAEFRKGRGRELFHEDGSHPSEFGDEVTARVIYATVFSGRERAGE